jgi:quercetin dioxygenase-like cupin family protein
VHHVGRAQDMTSVAPPLYDGHSRGYRQTVLVDGAVGPVHTHLTLNELEAGGEIGQHLHSFEEGVYLLAGEAVMTIDDEALRLCPGDFAVARVGALHGWRAVSTEPVRWVQMASPQPKPIGAERDTFFAPPGEMPSDGLRIGIDTHRALAGHFDVSQIPPPGEARSGLATLPGVFLKWLIDEAFGARHHRMLLIEYQPDVGIGLHDHAFEEAYYLLEGEVLATLDGRSYVVRAGDVVWTGVGCVHAFKNVSKAPVRWIETFAPQPPDENVFRFFAEWDAKGVALEGR